MSTNGRKHGSYGRRVVHERVWLHWRAKRRAQALYDELWSWNSEAAREQFCDDEGLPYWTRGFKIERSFIGPAGTWTVQATDKKERP